MTELLRHERIETTLAKGKEARIFAERMISLARQGSLAARRRALAFVRDPEVVARLFHEVGPRYRECQGGYTRLVKTRLRLGDRAQLVVLELILRREESKVPAPTAPASAPPRASKGKPTDVKQAPPPPPAAS